MPDEGRDTTNSLQFQSMFFFPMGLESPSRASFLMFFERRDACQDDGFGSEYFETFLGKVYYRRVTRWYYKWKHHDWFLLSQLS